MFGAKRAHDQPQQWREPFTLERKLKLQQPLWHNTRSESRDQYGHYARYRDRFQSGQSRGFTSTVWFPNRAYAVYMQVDEFAKRRKAGGGRLVR